MEETIGSLTGIECYPSNYPRIPYFHRKNRHFFVDKDKAVVVEAKGWRSVKKLGDNVVEADDSILHILLYSFHFYLNAMCRLVRSFRVSLLNIFIDWFIDR